jgi:hypothetical protein
MDSRSVGTALLSERRGSHRPRRVAAWRSHETSLLHPPDLQAVLANQMVHQHGARLAKAMARYRAAAIAALHRPDTNDDLPF